MGGDAGSAGATMSGGAGGSAGCFEIPVRSGCGDSEERSILCSPTSVPIATTSCGVRIADGVIFNVDAPYEVETQWQPVPNAFAELPGFRRCSQDEILATDCRDFSVHPSERSARFDFSNETQSNVWVLRAATTCTPFSIERKADGAVMTLALFDSCDAKCSGSTDAWENWTLVRLAPGAELSLPWDGRAFETVQTVVACASDPNFSSPFDGMDARCRRGPLVASAEGAYRASFWVYDDPSLFPLSECGDADTCEVQNDLVGVSDVMEACTGAPSAKLDVDFSLPAMGEVVVPVRIE